MDMRKPFNKALLATLAAGTLSVGGLAWGAPQGLYSADELTDADVYSKDNPSEDIGDVEDVLLDENMPGLTGLETLAKEGGASLGAGYAFPLTIEIAKDWTQDLQNRGVLLAPASALTAEIPAEKSEPQPVQTGSLLQAPLNPEG